MKKRFTLVLVTVLFANSIYSAAIEKLGLTSITFLNFSVNSYDITNHKLSVGNSWYLMSSLSLLSGNLNLSPSQSVTVGVTVPNGTGSVALWQPGTTDANASMSNIVDFIQYGAGGQAYESIAVQAFLTAVGIFAPGTLPIRRTDANTGPGNGNWVVDASSAETLESSIDLQFIPNPVSDLLTVSVSPQFISAAKNFNCSLYDATGRLWHSENEINSEHTTIPCSALPAGMYFIQLTSAEGATFQRKRLLKL